MTQSRQLPAILATLAALVLFFAIGALVQHKSPTTSDSGTTVIVPPGDLVPFELRDQRDAVFTPARFDGRWSFVFFGYTHCPDICPAALTVFKQIHSIAGGLDRGIQYVFISVDPERDTREVREKYTAYFSPEFLGVSGSHEELAKLAKTMGVYYRKTPVPPGGIYHVDHSAAIFLIDPQARLHAVYSAPQDPQRMAESLRRLRGK